MTETATSTYAPETACEIVTVDGQPTGLAMTLLEIDRHYEVVQFSRTPVVADETWQVYHGPAEEISEGHTHVWAPKDSTRPRQVTNAKRTSVNVPCDGTCGGVCGGEGYDRTAFLCDYDGEEIVPGVKDDPRGSTQRIDQGMTARIEVSIAEGAEVPAMIERGWKVVWMGHVPEDEPVRSHQSAKVRPPRLARQEMVLGEMHAGEVTYENTRAIATSYSGEAPPVMS